MSIKKSRVTLTLSPEILEQVDILAKEVSLSRSAFVEYLLNQTMPLIPMLKPLLRDLMDENLKQKKKPKNVAIISEEKKAVPLEGRYTHK